MKNACGVYIHIPFCNGKCPYCDFYSVRGNTQLFEQYSKVLCYDIKRFADKCEVAPTADTVYFGGGTPTALPCETLCEVLDEVKRSFNVTDDAEITVEANPCTVSFEYLERLRTAGFNRISFGVQSAVDSELKALGRRHTFEQAVNAVLDAKNAGFDNISCDLMLGIIGQTCDSLSKSVSELCRLPITHISAYMLKIESGTPYDCELIKSRVADDDMSAQMYLQAVKQLESSGFEQYEISSFAKDSNRSRHNMKYWTLDEYVGFGASAHSFYDGKRFFYDNSVSDYINSPESCLRVEDDCPDRLEEYTMLSLRITDGLDVELFKQLGGDVCKLGRLAKRLSDEGLCLYDGKILRLTPQGFLLSNSIIAMLL